VFRDKLRDGNHGPILYVVRAGSFVMGADDEFDMSGPAHPVSIDRHFAIMVHEVRQADFGRFTIATDYLTDVERKVVQCYPWNSRDRDPKYNWRLMPFKQNLEWPVVCVTWNDAEQYASWLSEQTGETYRLPTEAEWEYAARAGTNTRFPFGNDHRQLCKSANIADASSEFPWRVFECSDGVGFGTAKTTSYQPNAWGLFDMIGNVSEYTQDCWHKNFKRAPADGSAWRKRGDCDQRTVRGGSWVAEARKATSARRASFPIEPRGDLGFRLVREVVSAGTGTPPN
jgi:formylglycine-generating enzyme required for sulfatase activity